MKQAEEFAFARSMSRFDDLLGRLADLVVAMESATVASRGLVVQPPPDDPEAVEAANRHIRMRAGAHGYADADD